MRQASMAPRGLFEECFIAMVVGMMRRGLALLLIGWLAICCSGLLWAQERAASGRFIALSDLHLDPFVDPTLVDELAAADPAQWRVILGRATRDRYGDYGRDTVWPLLESALEQMRAVEPDPAFLILTGDLFAHGFRAKFEANAARRGEDEYRAFVRKTLSFMAAEITRRFPGKRVFLTLGNEDSDCGDYRLAPDGGFLHDSLPAAAQLAGADDDPAFRHGWLAGYGFDLASGAVPGLRIISVNSMFLSARYRDTCGSVPPPTLGDDVLAWLTERLELARRAGVKVWLIFHIPPGADPYATVRNGACPAGLTPMWASRHARRLANLLRQHADTVTATYAGHTHMDEFRVIGSGGRIDGFRLNTPGISPVFGQNPGFHVYSYGASAELLDRETRSTRLLDDCSRREANVEEGVRRRRKSAGGNLPCLRVRDAAYRCRRVPPMSMRRRIALAWFRSPKRHVRRIIVGGWRIALGS
jgi:sphingomyelin phosphodiesterase acid-like 3